MPPRPAVVRSLARGAARALPSRVRSAGFRRLAPLLRVGGTEAGLATLVVLCEPVDLPRLPETLETIRHDAHAYREVLLAPVGQAAHDGIREAVLPLSDPRVRMLPVQPTWQEAANAGADAAQGRFLQFLRACDRRLPDTLAALAGALAASGSDLAVGAITQRGRSAAWLERTTALVHDRDATVAPGDHPLLAGDLGLGNKLLPTLGWRRSGCRLGPLDGWLLSPTMARYLATVRQVDVLTRPVHEHVGGHGVRPFGAMPSQLRDLSLWCARADQVERVLAGSPFLDGWLFHVRDVALPCYLMDAERAADADWALLRGLAERHYPDADRHPGEGWARAESRTLLWLTRADRRADVVALGITAQALEGDVPTVVAGRHVLAAWPGLPDDVPEQVRRLSAAETSLVAVVHRLADLGHAIDVELLVGLGQVDVPAYEWALGAALPDGGHVEVVAEADPVADRWAGSRFHRALRARCRVPAGTLALRLSLTVGDLVREGEVILDPPLRRHESPDPGVVVRGLRLDGGALVVDHEGPGALRLLDDADRLVAELGQDEDRIELCEEHYGRSRHLPTGHYRLVTPFGVPTVAQDLVARLPAEQVGEWHRLSATLGPVGGLLLHLGPPLADDEQGPWAQEQLVRAYAADVAPPDPGVVYFESYAGRSATDSPRAIHEALRSMRPDLRTYWGVLDHAQEVPEGATPLLLRSREWYAVLARAGGLVLNTDVEAWFRRRPGQVLVQTFHGYPSKGMGLGQWRAAQLPESQVRVARAKGVDSWSAIVTPTPEMTRHYREQYGYTGPAFERGYPRNDLLVRVDEAAEVRRRTRALLGLRDDQTAVLYAPTWREHQATRARRADLVPFLDVEQAARSLGGSHVLLLRGHRFHARRTAGRGVLDVTDHPEVNDLILAADVAVLDYSSLRFDFALTGKPMVFLVPDLGEYAAGTRSFLFPFEDSAPGPFVDDTAGVVEQVRDVAALRARWAGPIAEFNARYHPFQDGHAAERVAAGLLDLLVDPTA